MMFFLLISVFASGIFSHPALAQTGGAASPIQVAFVPNFVFDLLTRLMLAVTRLALSLMLFVLTFIVQVASYNSFLSSDAVNVGWVMVRDLTNMVFVVALLIIAFGTILGIEHYEWKHMLFKLVAAAVLVNFSRVICGIIIDVAQVVMVTFVNGISSTIGGNFIRAFSLDSIRSFSSANNLPINSEGVWLSALASLFISVTILVTSGVLLAMLVARVLVLWVLIVLSPIAFVFGVLDQTKSYASEWWSQFGKNVITGPVLVFFLWLTLVTVGNGMVSTQFATTAQNTNAFSESSGIGQALRWDSLVNFVIAIGMLLVGIKVTQQLGGIGAEWTGKAVDIGKKVTMAVSGISTVRKTAAKGYELAGKGVELAKARAVRPFVRAGEKLGARATQLYSEKIVEPRIEAASERQKLLAKTPEGEYKEKATPWQRLKARAGLMAAPGVVKDKVAAAEKAAAEARVESWEHLVSSTSTPEGQRKAKALEELEFLKTSGEAIKASKRVDVQERMAKAMDVMGNKELSEEEKTAELSKLGYSGERFKVYADRRKKARDAGPVAEQKKALLQIEEEMAKMGIQEDMTAPVVLANRNVATVTANPQSLVAAKDEVAQYLKNNRASLKKSGESEADLDKRLTKMGDEMNKRLEYQFRQAQASELVAKTAQRKEGITKAVEREEVRAKERLAGTKEYAEREGKIAGFSAEISQVQDKLATKKQLTLLTSIRELLSEQRRAGGGREAEILADKARAMQDELEQANAKNLAIATARDNYLIGQNRSGEATNIPQELDKQAKVRFEAQAVGDFVSAMARLNQQKELVERLKSEKKPQEAIDRAEMTLSDMFTANAARHAAFANAAREVILPKNAQNPRNMSLDFGNIRQLQADEVSTLLADGEVVEATKEGLEKGMEKLLKKYERSYGSSLAQERMQAVIENRRQKMEAAAGQGAMGLAGLWRVTLKDGKLRTDLTDINNTGGELSKEAIDYIGSRRAAAIATSKLTSMTGGLGGSVDRDLNGRTVVNSKEAVEFVVNAAAPVKDVHLDKVDEYIKQDLGSIIKNSTPEMLKVLLAGLEKKMKDIKARAGLLQFGLDKVKLEAGDDAGKVAENVKMVKELMEKKPKK